MLQVERDREELTVSAVDFTVRYSRRRPHYFTLSFQTFEQEFFIPAACDSPTEFDLNISAGAVRQTEAAEFFTLSFEYTSTLWKKIYYLDIYPDRVEFYYDLHGAHSIDTLRFFEGIFREEFSAQCLLTKHFNDRKTTDYREYSTASPVAFKKLHNPEPNTYCKQLFEFFEYSQISANSDLDYCGGNFVFNPGILCFAGSAAPASEWISFGLGVAAGAYHFSEYEYIGGVGFGLNLNYWGALEVAERFRTPKLIITVADTPATVLHRYVSILRHQGLIPPRSRPAEKWWQGPIICGWGHQCYKADLFRVRSPKERPADTAAYFMCTQAHYEEFIGEIEKHELDWRILTIDARWTINAGLKEIDAGRWPDMRGFVEKLHRRGKRVLIWWGMWETEGLEPEECITYSAEMARGKVNRPGRFAKFGNLPEAGKIAPDPTLESFRRKIAARIEYLLGPDGIDLDGFKIDHVAATPGMYGLKFPAGSRQIYGIELIKYYQKFIYETAKAVKPDALIVGQSANPYFADCTDMLRLGDLYPTAHSVNEQMIFRAEMARIASPHWLIDMDNWPLPNSCSLREYADIQGRYGVPSLYYATHLDTTGEAITAEEFRHIRRLWDEYLEACSSPFAVAALEEIEL